MVSSVCPRRRPLEVTERIGAFNAELSVLYDEMGVPIINNDRSFICKTVQLTMDTNYLTASISPNPQQTNSWQTSNCSWGMASQAPMPITTGEVILNRLQALVAPAPVA